MSGQTTADTAAGEQAAAAELMQLLSDFEWRINNLYYIKDKDGKAVQFKPNWAQLDFLKNMHYCNIILKARQLGFTTLIALYFLDAALFNNNHHCGIIAQGLKEATDIFDNKIKFAYDNLPQWLRDKCPLITSNTEEMEFSHGSKIIVGLSLRSGTFQKLHISELGKVSAKFPEKAKEIKSGALNTVHAGNQIFVESTAEGQSGVFFDMVQLARKIEDEGRQLQMTEFKFHFYPWYKNPDYVLPAGDALRVVITDEMAKYFRELETEHQIFLTFEQKAWYVVKEAQQLDDMQREFPSTPDESFAASLEGAIYARQMKQARKAGLIIRVPHEPKALVNTFWDLGTYNYMAIWFFQQIARERRMIRFYQNAGADLSQYVEYMRDLGYIFGNHYLPHDGERKILQATGGNKSVKELLVGLGLKNIKIVPRTNDVRADIEGHCKPAILATYFDIVNCADGIKCLDNYRKEQNRDGIWLETPKHDEFSDGCDAFRTYAVGYKDSTPAKPVSFALDGVAPL